MRNASQGHFECFVCRPREGNPSIIAISAQRETLNYHHNLAPSVAPSVLKDKLCRQRPRPEPAPRKFVELVNLGIILREACNYHLHVGRSAPAASATVNLLHSLIRYARGRHRCSLSFSIARHSGDGSERDCSTLQSRTKVKISFTFTISFPQGQPQRARGRHPHPLALSLQPLSTWATVRKNITPFIDSALLLLDVLMY